jgi:glycerate kinase
MDAGTGLLQALGVRFFNEDHQSLMPTGANLGKIENLKTDGFALANSKVEIIFLCDVDLPLLEENEGGGVMRFGGQKGLSPQDRPLMHAAFGNFRNLMEAKHHGKPKLPGMGAGGGMAFALSGLYPVRLEPGGKWVANAIGLDQSIHEADLVITGEGRLDSTTFNGKCVSVVADMAVRQDKPVVAIVGKNALKAEEWSELGLDSVYPLMPDGEHSGLEMSSSLAAIQTATRQFVLDHRLKLK